MKRQQSKKMADNVQAWEYVQALNYHTEKVLYSLICTAARSNLTRRTVYCFNVRIILVRKGSSLQELIEFGGNTWPKKHGNGQHFHKTSIYSLCDYLHIPEHKHHYSTTLLGWHVPTKNHQREKIELLKGGQSQ
jgi:hypothetical protein